MAIIRSRLKGLLMKCPEELKLWTGDECAECLPISRDLSSILWGLVNDASNPTPMGGDGSNGTVETSDGRLSEKNDDKMANLWVKLNRNQQLDLIDAAKKEGLIRS